MRRGLIHHWCTKLAHLTGLLVALVSAPSYAAPTEAATEQVKARIVANVTAVQSGEEILVGVQQQIIPHWHTYWINPGDSGSSTEIEWHLPEGASAGPIQWPTPSRFSLGPITNYGYTDEVTLLSSITVPKTLAPGERFAATAVVDWLVCAEECIPQQVTLGLDLPVIAPGTPREIDPESRAIIESAQARLPVPSPWQARFERSNDRIRLRLTGARLDAAHIKDVWFYAQDWGAVEHGAPQPVRQDGNDAVIELAPGEEPKQALAGVLVIKEEGGDGVVERGFTIATDAIAPASPLQAPSKASLGFMAALGLALLGGLILNLMPCVFPVLSMKALALLGHAEHSRTYVRISGLAYTAGVLVSFVLLAGLLLVLRAGGAQIGWGFQFQSPLFVAAMAYLMFAVGLSLSGVFYIGGSFTGVGSSLAARAGHSGSFFTGVLATIVATPCTAPFMGAALGYALTQPPLQLFAVFLSLGLGLALPYLGLTWWPSLQRRLPRPGVWMERVKQALAFPMYAAAVWLVWVLSLQAGADAVAIVLGGMVALAFAAWIFQTTRNSSSRARPLGSAVAAAAFIAVIAVSCRSLSSAAPVQAARDEQTVEDVRDWEPFSAERLQALRANGQPVFLNFTAAWCITCLANERVALSQTSVKEAFAAAGIAYLKGDWTHRDANITRFLEQFGRNGVPLYVFYPSGIDSRPIVLPQILTPDIVLNAIGVAGKSTVL